MRSVFNVLILVSLLFTLGASVCAQEVNVTPRNTPAASAATVEAPAKQAAESGVSHDQTFWDVVTHGGIIGLIIWILMFITSIIAVGLIIDGFVNIREDKLMPPDLIKSIKGAMDKGDLTAAVEICRKNPCPLSTILLAGFMNVTEGFDEIIDYVSSAAEEEIENLMQRVNYLSLQSGLAPMLGLMGTVTGMIDAFAGLATATGSEKAHVLALAISQALYATAVGLLVAIPAIVCFTIIKNKTQKLIMRMERITYDVIKNLKNVHVVVED